PTGGRVGAPTEDPHDGGEGVASATENQRPEGCTPAGSSDRIDDAPGRRTPPHRTQQKDARR
ncbi:MAG: hypothetical protein WC558_12245, partial [Patulibacter sp.]